MKISKFLYKRDNYKYVPNWMYFVKSLASLADGFFGLFLSPFGYETEFTIKQCEKIIEYSIKKYKRG
jgi:hypothetical protein